MDLKYSDGIAAERTLIAVEANAAALQRRLPAGWEVAPYAGDDLRGTSLRGANMLLPFQEVYALRSQNGQPAGLSQVSYVAFISQARNQATGALAIFTGFFIRRTQPVFRVNIAMANLPTSHARRLSRRSNAARPKFGKVFRPWPMMARSNCPLHICKGEWWLGARLKNRTCRFTLLRIQV